MEPDKEVSPRKSPTSHPSSPESSDSSSTDGSTSANSTTSVDPDLTSDDVESHELSLANNRPQSGLIHDHILPLGWTCIYESETDRYKFEYLGERAISQTRDEAVLAKTPTVDHVVQTSRRPTFYTYECKYGYHFPSSPTPSMISDLAKQVQKAPSGPSTSKGGKQVGYGKFKITIPSDEEEQTKRIREMFPTATPQIVEQMIRIYHGREGLIKAALISLGYKRSTEYDAQQATSQSPIMMMMAKPSSKKLYEKLINYFPDRDETLIKQLMYKHKEVEHEIISVLVGFGHSSDGLGADELSARSRSMRSAKVDRNGAIMKLRYLKSLYPTCDETDLYHLLHCNNLNAQKVMEIVEKRNHKRANIDEVIENRKSQTKQMRAHQAAQAARASAVIVDPVEVHRARTRPVVNEARVDNLKENLKKSFENVWDEMIVGALEAADYNEALAKKFLETLPPIDDDFYKQRYELPADDKPPAYFYPCKGVQKGDLNECMSLEFKEFVAIPREVIECENALALMKVDACTFTQDDGFEEERSTHALGKRANLAHGSIFKELKVTESQRRGPQIERQGSVYKQVWARDGKSGSNKRSRGRNEELALKSNPKLRLGHNPKLIKNIHPFFLEPKKLLGTHCKTVQSSLDSTTLQYGLNQVDTLHSTTSAKLIAVQEGSG